jgi:hypothetical protein
MIAYCNGGPIEIPRGGNKDCMMVIAAPMLPVGYVVNASRIADRRIIPGYRYLSSNTAFGKLRFPSK